MSIKLTSPRQIAGTHYPVDGSTLVFSTEIEAALVGMGVAVWVSAPVQDNGALFSRFEKAGFGHRIKPSLIPVPWTVMASGVPFVIPPGDGASAGLSFSGAAGAFTLSAAIVTSQWQLLKACWIYFAAGSLGYFDSTTAGWYYAEFSSDTAGTVYAARYTSGNTAPPATKTEFPANLSGFITTTTAEITGPNGFVLPAGSLGLSGVLRADFRLHGATAGNKIFALYAGATKIANVGSVGASPDTHQQVMTQNQGVANRQLNSRSASPTGIAGSGSTIAATEYASFDSSVDQSLSASLQVSATSSCAILSGLFVTAQYGA